MQWIDLFIGLTLMNAMPHYILGTWKGKMLSGFGVGDVKNILWGVVNALASVALFIYKYGKEGFAKNQVYTGALIILLTFFLTSPFWYRYFYKKTNDERG
ncbi:MAG TPA: hypothetical protein VL651_04205 [Bacteroidia bacterium]|jgi:hypothetical protein|nr:hypothetical protein [Bacteroidia bacterium]